MRSCVHLAGRQIGVPGLAGDAGGFRQRLAQCAVGTLEAAEIGALAGAHAGDKEAHRGVLGSGAERPPRQHGGEEAAAS